MQSSTFWSFGYRLGLIFLFDIVWFVAVWGRETYLPLTILFVVLLYAANYKTLWPKRLGLLILIAAGLALETLMVSLGVLQFTNANILPEWLFWLWLGFGAMAFSAMDWLAGRYALAWIFGLVFGPITYLAGVRFEAAEITSSFTLLVVGYGVMWGVLMHLLSYLLQRNLPHQVSEEETL
ncbi:MAG: membrane protein of unknown function DUF2878 [Idiomarinaceae bacterium HL-53]|nr:MAG: membrane protein of unknown function DUF2878 [Idiomarinaceae bacterium HL-53]CUS48902.1 Protein of unknown function (DUF2878) [Idiomarinaceae bacterium HL-53]